MEFIFTNLPLEATTSVSDVIISCGGTANLEHSICR